MILCFPDLDTFRLVVTSTLLPADVTLSPAEAHLAPDGRVFIDTPAKLPKKATGELTKLGVAAAKALPGEALSLSCWLQLLPATKDAAPPQLASQAPVLFELPAATDLPAIVGEMLRLGNDRQSFRFLADDGKNRRVLLRVIGPPYYTLLRALDQLGGPGQSVRAYTEAAPRVWVQVGYTHPAASGMKPADEQVVLIRAPRDWEYLPDAPFQDVYDILQFKLPTAAADWTPAEAKDKLTVPLKLVPGNAADAPELWVLKGDAARQLDEFVRDSDERLTNRLKFAVADAPNGEKVVVLRVSPSKLAPPSLQFPNAVGFKPFFKLPNLFLPVGTRLHPQLRRDAVRTLLADDTDRVAWLFPGADGKFIPETLSENAFRPLEDWVDYVVELAHAPLKEWIDASRFRFENYVCADGQSPKPKPPGDKPGGKAKGDRDDGPLQSTGGRGGRKKAGDGDQAVPVPSALLSGPPKPPNEWKIKRDELEKEFLAVDGPLDATERAALWPQLAVANAGAGDAGEAAVCWANAAWVNPDPAVLTAWAASETLNGFTEKELDRRLAQHDPARADARQTAAGVLALVAHAPLPAWFAKKLPAVQRYFEANEAKLSVRAVWLLATTVARTAGADVLGLARVRDRLLQRLLEGGLNPELDIPFFLRSAGLHDSERVRMVRDKLPDLHRLARAWVAKPPTTATSTVKPTTPTMPYVDLLFAFALAKLGESAAARATLDEARKQLGDGKSTPEQATTRSLLFRAYQYRVEQSLGNKPHVGPLPSDLVTEIDEFQKKNPLGANAAGAAQNLGHYPIARLREQSKVLEPQEKHDPYNEWMKHGDDLKKKLAELPKIKDPAELAKTIRELYRTGGGGRSVAECRFLVLHEGMPFAARVSEEFTVELLGLVAETMAAAGTGIAELGKKQGQLLERSLFLAAHFDRRDLLQQLVDQFVSVLGSKTDEDRFDVINFVAGQCLRSLRKMGLQDEIDRLLKRMAAAVLENQTLPQFRVKYAGNPARWGKALQSLLHIAGGWLTFGLAPQAIPILDEARGELLGGAGAAKLSALDFTKLCTAYISAVGQGPVETGLPRLTELLGGLDPNRVTNTFTTAQFYSRLHLNVVEELVLAVASDDFAVGAAGRRWLEDDEYLVRRRIHADMRKHLSAGGL